MDRITWNILRLVAEEKEVSFKTIGVDAETFSKQVKELTQQGYLENILLDEVNFKLSLVTLTPRGQVAYQEQEKYRKGKLAELFVEEYSQFNGLQAEVSQLRQNIEALNLKRQIIGTTLSTYHTDDNGYFDKALKELNVEIKEQKEELYLLEDKLKVLERRIELLEEASQKLQL